MALAYNFLLFCSFLLLLNISATAKTSSRPKALVLPVTKDASTSQYLTQIHQRTPLVPVKLTLDLGGRFLWVDCENGYRSSSYKPARCNSAQCNLAGVTLCTTECYSSPKPGCYNNTCGLFPANTVKGLSTSGDLGQDVVSIQSTDGYTPGRVVSAPNVIFTCGATFLLEGLANGVKGMAGLGRSKISLPSQLSAAFSFPRKFAICLSGSKGVVFFGDGPYVLLPGIDASKLLSYTPLILNPVSTAPASFKGDPSTDYFIGVKGIKINGKNVPLNTSLLAIDKEGNGGTKISTVTPYTVMETSIYNAVIRAFAKALSGVPKVAAVAPFGLCFDSSKIGSTRLGPGVPQIDLLLPNGNSWAIFGANSMVYAKGGALCLGIVDGGVNPTTSIVIGGHQLEDNLIQIDLAASRLGFSSTLLFRRTNCGNFNFTSSINGNNVPLNTSLLSIDKEGYGGTKISTVTKYTTMETSIYKAVIKAFAKELSGVPRVASVASLELCFDSNKIGRTRVGPAVPQFDLVLESGNSWGIFGANSMVQVNNDVLCLGILDGGANPRTSIVIGGHQW
ncbi:GLC7-interacting protein 2, partial [Turnera subulata]